MPRDARKAAQLTGGQLRFEYGSNYDTVKLEAEDSMR